LAAVDLAQGASPFYAPEPWQPHITLAQRDLTLATLRAIQAEWSGRDVRRMLWVDNLTLLYRAAGAMTNQPRMRFSLGSANNAAND
jgi:hypothetical protein